MKFLKFLDPNLQFACMAAGDDMILFCPWGDAMNV